MYNFSSHYHVDLLFRFLTYDPTRRWSADDAKQHDYFNAHPLPVDPSLFPTWPARSEQPRGKRQETPKPPSGGQAFKLLVRMSICYRLMSEAVCFVIILIVSIAKSSIHPSVE